MSYILYAYLVLSWMVYYLTLLPSKGIGFSQASANSRSMKAQEHTDTFCEESMESKIEERRGRMVVEARPSEATASAYLHRPEPPL